MADREITPGRSPAPDMRINGALRKFESVRLYLRAGSRLDQRPTDSNGTEDLLKISTRLHPTGPAGSRT